MKGLPVTIRLLDPPLHEFLPNKEDLLVEVTKLQILDPQSPELKSKEQLLKKVRQLDEFNPMLGHRGTPSWNDLSRDLRNASESHFLCKYNPRRQRY